MWIVSVLEVALFICVLLLLLAVTKRIFAGEGASLLDLLNRGRVLEFTTRPGAVSFMTFVVVCFMGLFFASQSDVLRLLYDFFKVQGSDQNFSANYAMAYALAALILNFIFIAYMRGSRGRRRVRVRRPPSR
jgi:hypothetical protein